MKKLFYLITSVSLLIVAVSLAYYYFVTIPHKEEIRANERREEALQKANSICINKYESKISELNKLEAEALENCWATKVCTHEQLLAELSKRQGSNYLDWQLPQYKGLFLDACMKDYPIPN